MSMGMNSYVFWQGVTGRVILDSRVTVYVTVFLGLLYSVSVVGI